jgi:hypothetical protein
MRRQRHKQIEARLPQAVAQQGVNVVKGSMMRFLTSTSAM